MKTTELLTDNFKTAIKDYYYLLNRGYSQKALLKLTGDRYSLSAEQRIILYRGIVKTSEANYRKRKKGYSVRKKYLYIDCYNVLLTISNYLYGRNLYISNDGFLRDAGQIYGKIRTDKVFYKSVDHLFIYLIEKKPEKTFLFIDSPVSYSGEFALYLKEKIIKTDIDAEAIVTKSPDYKLKQVKTGVISTSDSVIIDNTEVKTIDIARNILKQKYRARFIKLGQFL